MARDAPAFVLETIFVELKSLRDRTPSHGDVMSLGPREIMKCKCKLIVLDSSHVALHAFGKSDAHFGGAMRRTVATSGNLTKWSSTAEGSSELNSTSRSPMVSFLRLRLPASSARFTKG